MDCKQYPLATPIVVAIATDKYLKPKTAFADPDLPKPHTPKYGPDITFGLGRAAPQGHSVGTTEAVLKPKMQKLLSVFASDDASGMASRLFTKFLGKLGAVAYFEDNDLSKAAAAHTNIKFFCNAAVAAPNTAYQAPGKTRIHQALKAASWDITKMTPPTDLGVPAFNDGSKFWSSGDFGNGLGVMINGVQYVYIVATHYNYDSAVGKYCIVLKYYLYDIFGLDDDDLDEYGEASDGTFSGSGGVGITAWWQLQHQFAYAPLVTRIVLEMSMEVAAI